MTKHTNNQKTDLISVEHFIKYPSLIPFIGEEYENGPHKRLLIIGESHYLPQDSTIHMNPDQWYAGDHNLLSNEEISWMSTSDLIVDSLKTDFKTPAHKIFQEIAFVLDQISDNKTDWHDKMSNINKIAFMNFFQRPAVSGLSVVPTKIDIDVANQTVNSVIQIIKPELIIFCSTLAANNTQLDSNQIGIPIHQTPHPSSAWWNRKSKKYDDKNGYEAFVEILVQSNWAGK
jgi:hypothetical protein